jgi:hypothetical protein
MIAFPNNIKAENPAQPVSIAAAKPAVAAEPAAADAEPAAKAASSKCYFC